MSPQVIDLLFSWVISLDEFVIYLQMLPLSSGPWDVVLFGGCRAEAIWNFIHFGGSKNSNLNLILKEFQPFLLTSF